jgi:hypothetical protein
MLRVERRCSYSSAATVSKMSSQDDYHSRQRRNKKRRRSQTLNDYFPVRKSKATTKDSSLCTNDNNPLLGCATDILYKSIFAYLCVRDLTSLSATCHRSQSLVEEFRGGEGPYIIQQEMSPAHMVFINFQGPTHPFYEDDEFDVSRVRTFRFLMKSSSHRNSLFQVEINLGVLLWTEGWNYVEDHIPTFGQRTWVECTIMRQVKYRDGSRQWHPFFENIVDYVDEGDVQYNLENFGFKAWKEAKEPAPGENRFHHDDPSSLLLDAPDDKGNPSRSSTIALSVEENERSCAQCFWVCANRIASSPPSYNFPSLHYMIKKGLPRPLYRYLPASFSLDPIKANIGPSNVAVWKYRRASSREERQEFFRTHETKKKRDVHGQLFKALLIHEIPWYTEWYPEPRIVNPKNVFSCISDELFAGFVLPYLSRSDVDNLASVWPHIGNFFGRPEK